jgi:Tol biopolymer transport system component
VQRGRLAAVVVFVALVASSCAYVTRSSHTTIRDADTVGAYGPPSISGDGRYVAYAARLDSSAPSESEFAILVRDHRTATSRALTVASDGTPADGWSGEPVITPDGRYVAYSSDAENLVPLDENITTDVFVWDRVTGATERVSVATNGTEGDDASYTPSISNDGRYVAFLSDAESLVDDDFNASTDVYVRDRVARTTTRASVTSTEVELEDSSWEAEISGNGRYVAFTTDFDLPGEANFASDVYRRDLVLGRTTRVSTSSEGGWDPSISDSGRWVSISTTGRLIATTDTNIHPDIYVIDADGTARTLVSSGPAGTTVPGNSLDSNISGDGRYVTFQSAANITGTDANGTVVDVFVRDLQAAKTWLAGTELFLHQVPTGSNTPRVSDDGRYVVFGTKSSLEPGDTNGVRDFYTRAFVLPEPLGASPTTITRGVATTVTVIGRHFRPGMRVQIANTYASAVNVTSETSLTAQITLPASTTLGKASVFVMNVGTGLGADSGTVGECKQCVTVT